MTSPVSVNPHADLALAVYLEPYAHKGRVLVLDSADSVLVERLDQVAHALEVVDPASFQGEADGELPFDDGMFDLVVLGGINQLPEPRASIVREAARVTDASGIVVAHVQASRVRRRRSEPAHGVLADLLAVEFRNVRLLRQTPLSAYALADAKASESDEIAVDASLFRGERERPERFVALASEGRLQVEGRIWIQTPLQTAEAAVDPRLVESLRRAEDEAREALHREADLLRELETTRRAREVAEQAEERVEALEGRLLSVEADYDDAVGRVRYFEGLVGDREASLEKALVQVDQLEHELERAREGDEKALAQVASAETAAREAQAGEEAARSEAEELEQRLREVGNTLAETKAELKQKEITALDLLEELRRLEGDAREGVEHDARVAELEAERERAVQRALEAEVARESAQMRVDELRAQLLQLEGEADRASVIAADAAATASGTSVEQASLERALRESECEREQLRGERQGLSFRVADLEQTLSAMAAVPVQVELSASGILASADASAGEPPASQARLEELDAKLSELDALLRSTRERNDALVRELEEADRVAASHAADLERLEEAEGELGDVRRKLDLAQDDLRAEQEARQGFERRMHETQDEVSSAREQVARIEADTGAQMEMLRRREAESQAERDDAQAALAEARAILGQLAARLGAEGSDAPAIIHALEQRSLATGQLDALQDALGQSERARGAAEHALSHSQATLAVRDARIRELEERLARREQAETAAVAEGVDAPHHD